MAVLESLCDRFSLRPFSFVAVLVCGHSGCTPWSSAPSSLKKLVISIGLAGHSVGIWRPIGDESIKIAPSPLMLENDSQLGYQADRHTAHTDRGP